MWITKKNNEIKNVTNYNKKEFFNYPRQQLPNTYSQTGTIEILRIEFRKNIKLFSGKKIMGLEVSEKESLDIDTKEDLKIAGKIINKKTMIFPKVIF
jgi:CMP-N-acetylneuraminic acid synthetase